MPPQGSYAETLAFLLGSLRRPGCAAVPLVLVLNEFDQFALHGKQTLLYNLFDIVQSRGSPMVVLGLTCRLVRSPLGAPRCKAPCIAHLTRVH